MMFLGHCRYPKFFEIWIVYELGVFCDGLLGQGVDNPIAYFLYVDNVVNTIGKLGDVLWDCIHRWCIECKVDDMVEGLL
jgi:hypothetical protein